MATVNEAKQFQETEAGDRNLGISARALIVEARRHGGDVELSVGRMLGDIVRRTEQETRRRCDVDINERIKDYAKATSRKIICSFIASLEQHAAASNGLPPSMVISSYTLCRMVDVLNEVGYKADGYRAPNN